MGLTYLLIALALTCAQPAISAYSDPRLGRAAKSQEVSQVLASSEEFPDQVQGQITSDKLTNSGEQLTQANSGEQLTQTNTGEQLTQANSGEELTQTDSGEQLTQTNSGEQLTQTNGLESSEQGQQNWSGESSEEKPDPSLSFSQWSETPKPIVVPYTTKKWTSIEQVTEPPITKGEVEREIELLSQEYVKAEQEKGAPLTKQEIHQMEEKLEQKPWYRRLAHAVKHQVINPAGKWFSDTFGKRKKRFPNFLNV